MKRAFSDGYLTETGTGIAKILPATNPFLPESGEKKQTVIEKLKAYLSRFSNMLSDDSAGLEVSKKCYEDIPNEEEYAEEIPMLYRSAAEPLEPPVPD